MSNADDAAGYKISRYRARILDGPIVATMLWLAWPMILAEIITISYNLIDAYWLGKLGKEAFGAPTVSWPMIMLFHSVGFGLTSAGVAIISQYHGAGDRETAEKSAGMLMAFSLIVGSVLMALGIAASPLILSLIGIPEDIYPLAVSYSITIFAGEFITILGFTFTTIANSFGDTRTPTLYNAISAVTNIVLDPIMIFGLFGFPKLGVVGAALATIMSRSIVALAGIYYLFVKGFHGIKIRRKHLLIEKWWLKSIFRIGIPLSIQMSGNALGFTVMTSIVSRFGTVVVSAYGLAIRVIDIIQAFTWGLMRAVSIMIGQNIGAENYSRAREIAKLSLIFVFTALLAGSIPIYLWRTQLISFFIDDPEVIVVGSKLIEVFVWSIPFFGVFFIGNAIARGSGHTAAVTAIALIRLWILRIGLSIVFAFVAGMGYLGVWIAMAISNIGAGVLTVSWISRWTWLERVVQVQVKHPRVHRTL
ncbi:MAG: MATE family efflux transporter [Thermoprotei archaeon]|nr:MAG: MATE family efflux transporter [Thermoprotei archaeon]